MQITPLKLHNPISFQTKPKNKKQPWEYKSVNLNNLSPYMAYQRAILQNRDKERKEARELQEIIKRRYQNASKEIKVNPNFISLAQNPPEIKTYNNIDEILENAQTGEVFEFEEKLFHKSKDDITELEMSKETFCKLFMPLETLALIQGDLGDCYLISAIFDFLKNPNTRGLIFSMFKEIQDKIIVTIPDCKDFPISFDNKTHKQYDSQHLYGSLGIQMLEYAYYLTRCHKYGIENDINMLEAGNQMLVYDAFLNSGKTHAYIDKKCNYKDDSEEKILSDIDKYTQEIKNIQKALKNRKELERQNFISPREAQARLQELYSLKRCAFEDFETRENEHLATIDELLKLLIKHANDDNYIVSGSTNPNADFKLENKGILPSHAYSILSVNKQNETIDVVNPWNCSVYSTITFDEFKKYFCSVNVLKLD